VGALAQARLVLNKGDIMARQNQGINVKVPRVKVIKALEQSLVKLENNYKNQEAEDKKYLLAHDKWHKQVVKLATAKFNKGENVRVNVRYNGSINIDFDLPAGVVKLPKEPVRKYESIADYQYENSKGEIENALRVLNMCNDELISTATYGGITKYL
jgi:hypothetical protein